MKNTIILLIGYPGTGKYTIAKELYNQTKARLVDNHLINNPIFSLIEQDGKTPLPKKVWTHTKKIRQTILNAIKDLAPQSSFIFTNVLDNQDPDDLKIYEQIKEVAAHNKAHFIPVILHCDEAENARRIQSPERTNRLKMTCPNKLKTIRTQRPLLKVSHENLLEIDTTNITPKQAVAQILAHPALA